MDAKKPNFIVIGAMKAATTSLYTYLKQHPDVFMTKIKEPMFFNNYKQNNDYKVIGRKSIRNIDFQGYLNMFSQVRDEIAIGEASPSYIYNSHAPYLIKENFPEIKLIAILRHPTDRAYSNFLHARRSGKEPESNFEEAIKLEEERMQSNWSPLYHYINKGYYSVQLDRYLSNFPKENIRIYLFEDLTQNTNKTLNDIFGFLGVNQDAYIDFRKQVNVSGEPKGFLGWIVKKMRFYNLMPTSAMIDHLPSFMLRLMSKSIYRSPNRLDNNIREAITKRYYTKEIYKLEKIIERDLSHWL